MNKVFRTTAALLALCALHTTTAYSQAKIKAYFNHPVNTSLSTGVSAVYLAGGTISDTIVAYISRAKHTIDIAQYDYNQSSNDGAYANIAAAVDTAYAHGITVRWIYDGSSSNTGLAGLNSGIHTLGSPTTSAYGIMHNKFIVIDANSSNPDDAIVFTGSADWSSEMFHEDYNNVLFIQDSALAYAYTAEFNMMWGSTTAVPNTATSKFGPYKTDLGLHSFTIAGHHVELYFSPSDNTDAHIGTTILSANKDLYIGVYDFTRTGDAGDIITVKNNGVYTLAVVDQYTPATSSAVNSTLSTGLGSNYVVYTGSYIYHNKMMIVDPSDTCSDPIVETGSYNWTTSATSYNDENIVIIHNDTLANIYYQSLIQDFTTIGGGTFTHIAGCGDTTVVNPTQVPQLAGNEYNTVIYPNPVTTTLNITAKGPITTVAICNLVGQTVYSNNYSAKSVQIDVANLPAGIYLVNVNGINTGKFIKEKQ